MPRSDMWLSGVELEKMKEMDSAGSCDSVVSINSGFSDDSLEYLSAEEKACLMFLEETIEALETEEDSGLSNDEPDCVPAPGNLVTRVANLTACMSQSKITDVSLCRKAEPMNKISKDHNQILNYLVPTPLVLANGSTNLLSKSKKGFASKGGSSPKPAMTSKAPQTRPAVPSEVNVVVIPPPVKEAISPAQTGDHPAQWKQRPAECASPRGPLSYEGLVQLRKAVSMKRSQEVSHTAENQDKLPSKPIKHILLDERKPCAPADQHGVRQSNLPAVAPKPKKIPSSIPTSTPCPQVEKTIMNPQKVRMEALYKLGLLKDQESSTTPCPPLPPPTSTHHHSDSSSAPDPPQCKPPPVPTRGEPKMRQMHWTNGVVHHRSLSDLTSGAQPLSVKPVTGKSATLERSGLGLSNSLSSHTISDGGYRGTRDNPSEQMNDGSGIYRTKPRSLTLDTQTDSKESRQRERGNSLLQTKSAESGVRGQTGMVVSRMGVDRREALRKLGLLKD